MKSTYTVSPFLAVSRTELESLEELLKLTPASTYILAALLLKYVRLELDEDDELEELSLTIIVSFSFSFSFSFRPFTVNVRLNSPFIFSFSFSAVFLLRLTETSTLSPLFNLSFLSYEISGFYKKL